MRAPSSDVPGNQRERLVAVAETPVIAGMMHLVVSCDTSAAHGDDGRLVMAYEDLELIDADDEPRLVYVCGDCYAIVEDQALHDAWHQRLRDALENAIPMED